MNGFKGTTKEGFEVPEKCKKIVQGLCGYEQTYITIKDSLLFYFIHESSFVFSRRWCFLLSSFNVVTRVDRGRPGVQERE